MVKIEFKKITHCVVCNKKLLPKQLYHNNKFCNIECYRKHRKQTGWFKTKEMIKSKRGCVSRAKHIDRVPLYTTENEGKHGINWNEIYTQKQLYDAYKKMGK